MKSVREIVEKEMPEFVETVNGLSGVEINNRLAQLAKDTETVEDQKQADEKLESALLNAKELAAPYREAKKALRLKSRYLIQVLRERGEETV